MVDLARLRQQGFRPYRKTTMTFAKQMQTPFSIRLISGDRIFGQPGDYACVAEDGNDRWMVNRKVFERTYETYTLKLSDSPQRQIVRQGFRPFRKHQITWAMKLHKSQVVHTLEGDVTAHAGDYLCVGPHGEYWPQKAERFESHYERVSEEHV